MNYVSQQVTFQEIPDEVSLSFLISGCPLKCPGCHSADARDAKMGLGLNVEVLQDYLNKYSNIITCVLFLGGEWCSEELIPLLKLCQKQQLKTALYTGLEDVVPAIKEHLDYLKVGPWVRELGGLNSPNTNQRLIDLATGMKISFNAQGGQHGKIN